MKTQAIGQTNDATEITDHTVVRWGMRIEYRVGYGYAAHKNRGKFSGQKVHLLSCQVIVGVEDGFFPEKHSLGAKFLETGKPVLYSCHPACRTTQGQRAGRVREGFTADNVTCEKCRHHIEAMGDRLSEFATV